MYITHQKQVSTVKKTVMEQYKSMANATVGFCLFKKPKEGWIRTIRTALGMSGTQLGEITGMTRNQISILERKEIDGEITLNQLQKLAEQLHCNFTYALVPKNHIEDIVDEQVTKVALKLLNTNSENMFLEDQSIDEESRKRLLNHLKEQISGAGGRVIWNNIKE